MCSYTELINQLLFEIHPFMMQWGKFKWFGTRLAQHEPCSHVSGGRSEGRALPGPHPKTSTLSNAAIPGSTTADTARSPSTSDPPEMQRTERTTAAHCTKSLSQPELKLKINKGNYRKGSTFLVR